jgi:hypothetical protein
LFFRDAVLAQGVKGLQTLSITPDYRPPFPAGVRGNPKQYLVVNPNTPAQGNTTPANVFNSHFVTLWSTGPKSYILYDPSYGTQISGTGSDFRFAVGVPWEHSALSSIRLGFLDVNLRPAGPKGTTLNCDYSAA